MQYTKPTYNLRKVMKDAHRRCRYDPTCNADMKLAMQKAWSRARKSVQVVDDDRDPFDLSFM